jgi:hypothetical protein
MPEALSIGVHQKNRVTDGDGTIVPKETGSDTPRMVRLVIGNPLIMKEMAEHVPDAGSYALVTVLVDELLTACICRMTGWLVF